MEVMQNDPRLANDPVQIFIEVGTYGKDTYLPIHKKTSVLMRLLILTARDHSLQDGDVPQ